MPDQDKPLTKAQCKKLMLADLKRSGLTASDASKREIEPLTSEEMNSHIGTVSSKKFSNRGRWPAGYVIPYPDSKSKSKSKFWRVRFFEPFTIPDEKKARRYMQPPGKPPELYLDPVIKWKQIFKNSTNPIYIVEGEKKAMALCKIGRPAIGIGGVWSWLSDHEVIDGLAAIPWTKRTVTIVFDSDTKYKSQIQRARNALCNFLIKAGARPEILDLPDLPNHPKVGVDDFLVHHGGKVKAIRALDNLPRNHAFLPHGQTLEDLDKMKLPKLAWIVEDILPKGLAILAGRPKGGKSFLALDVAISVATGGDALNAFPTVKGDVLYLALEDNPRRVRERARQIYSGTIKPPKGVTIHTEWRRVEDHGLPALEAWLDDHPKASLVIIDTFARLRARPTRRDGPLYSEDYEAIRAFKNIADKYDVGILLVHHTRKQSATDPLDEISGSTGLTGAADTLLVLKRAPGNDETTLYIRGRDVAEQSLAFKFDPATAVWDYKGDAALFELSKAQEQIIEVFKAQKKPMTPMAPKDVAEALGKRRNTVGKLMWTMAKKDYLERTGDGEYKLPPETAPVKDQGGKNKNKTTANAPTKNRDG